MNQERVHKGYRVELRREINRPGSPGRIVSWLELDIFVDDLPESDRALVAHVFEHYPGFVVDSLQRLAV